MYLKRLEIHGFKTFAQRTTFEFPPGVTAVVGPNGSGKSNVADAVRWVLGEQSFANLRSKRTDDLVFGGGKGRAPMGFAEVFLTIDNNDRLLPLPYDEVTIGRRAYRSGENEYTINRARVRLRDVLDAVAPLGSSYTIINQGLVDTALALQPEDRRRLFEDAAEIGPYQAKKHEAERRLRETETNLVRLSDLVSELEPQLRTLKRQARDAEAVGAVEAELRELLLLFYAAHWHEAIARLEQATAEAQRLHVALEQARAVREQAAQALIADREQVRQQRADLERQRSAVADVERQQQRVGRELAVARERMTGLQQRQRERTERRAQLETQAGAAQKLAEHVETQFRESQQALHVAQQQHAEAEAALARELGERRAAEAALATHREALIRAAAARDTEQTRLHDSLRRTEAVTRELAEAAASIEQQQTLCDQREAQLTAAQRAIEDAEQRVGAANSALDGLRAALEQARRERERIDERITAVKRQQGELQARFDALNRLARSFEGAFAGVRAAMQWAERAGRNFALVSSLLRVPAELETAIEVALGARLQNIVVDRWADAEAAIEQLKRSGAGRATFLPLDTLKPARQRSVPDLSGVRGVAADLIEVEAHAHDIAAYLLGRILIADDLAAARRALPELEGGWTIVTLSGEQIATGGAVTGGAATRESGTLRRERELRELPQQLETARISVEQAQTARASVMDRISALETQMRQAEAAIRAARSARDEAQRAGEARRRELHRAEDELSALQRRRSALEQEQAHLVQQAERTQAALTAAEQAHAAAEATATAAQAVLAEQLSAVGEDEAALREIRAAVAQVEAEVRRLEAEARTHRQTITRIGDELRSIEAEMQALAQELAVLDHSVTEQQAQQDVFQQKLAALQSALLAATQAVQAHDEQLEAREALERERTAAASALEGAYAEAAIELERRRSERDALWERAAEDDIDVEQLNSDHESVGSSLHDQELPQRIEQLRNRLRRMGPVNALAPEEFRAAQERHAFLTTQLADVRAAAAAMRDAISQLDHVMEEHFSSTFEAVAREFSRKFTQLFGGGSARLVLLRGENGDGAYHGIDIIAQPPGKRQLNLQLLSGGERALTAAALLFAILTVNPSPFCILDEVDAALDEANVVRFREALLELAQQTQFILITHNRGTVEAADTMYGITMADDGGSRVLSLRLEEISDDGSLALRTVS